MKIYAVVLHREWADELGPIVKPYLYPMRAGFEDFAVLYADAVETGGTFFEATVADSSGNRSILRFPHNAVRITIESATPKTIGFLTERE